MLPHLCRGECCVTTKRVQLPLPHPVGAQDRKGAFSEAADGAKLFASKRHADLFSSSHGEFGVPRVGGKVEHRQGASG